MDIERALVCKIVSTGQLEEAISKGVRSDLFFDDECQDVFDYIVEHARRYKSTPSTSALQTDREDFEFVLVQEPMAYLIDKFNAMAKKRLATDMVLDLAKLIEDPNESDKIDTHFMESSRKLAMITPATEVHRFVGDMDKRINDYERRVKEGHKFGHPWGYPTLDLWTKGMRRTDYNVVAGFTGIGKSTFLKAVAFNTWTIGKVPLYITLEEEGADLAERWDAMAADLDFGKLSQLDLNEEQLKQWRSLRERAIKGAGEIPVIDKIRNCTPDNIYAEMIRHDPDLVIVDYVQLMRSSRPQQRGHNQWSVLTEITQDLKQIARSVGIPILAAAQTNRDGGKQGAELDNIGGSISITQDADVAVGLYADEDMKEAKTIQIRVMKNRRGKLGKFDARCDHEKGDFREIGKFERPREQRGNLEEQIREQQERPRLRKRPGT